MRSVVSSVIVFFLPLISIIFQRYAFSQRIIGSVALQKKKKKVTTENSTQNRASVQVEKQTTRTANRTYGNFVYDCVRWNSMSIMLVSRRVVETDECRREVKLLNRTGARA